MPDETSYGIVEFHVDLGRPAQTAFVVSGEDSRQAAQRQYVQGDRFLARIYFYRRQTDGSLLPVKFVTGTVIGLQALAVDPLRDQGLWEVGDFELSDDETYYEADVSMNTPDMEIFGVSSERRILVGVQVADSGESFATSRNTVAHSYGIALADPVRDSGVRDIRDQKATTNWDGFIATIQKNGVPMNLTGATVSMKVRELDDDTETEVMGGLWTTEDDTILLTSAGTFQVVGRVIAIDPGQYKYSVRIVLADLDSRIYLQGHWKIIAP